MGQTAGTGLLVAGGITAFTGVMVASGGCVSLDEDDQMCSEYDENEPDPEAGLAMIGGGLAAAMAGVGVAAASSEGRRSKSRAPRKKGSGKPQYQPQRIPAVFPEGELALLSRAHLRQQRHPVDDRYRCADLFVHPFPDADPASPYGLDRGARCPPAERQLNEPRRR